MNSWLRKLGWLIRRRSKHRELEAELQFHLVEEAEERRLQGLSEREALAAARRECHSSVLFVLRAVVSAGGL